MSKWIEFVDAGASPSGKTLTWRVVPKDGSAAIGRIEWHGPWRKYIFDPYMGSLFEEDCLRDIAQFLQVQTALHREKRKAKREGAGMDELRNAGLSAWDNVPDPAALIDELRGRSHEAGTTVADMLDCDNWCDACKQFLNSKRWLTFSVDGFRIDVCDRHFRD